MQEAPSEWDSNQESCIQEPPKTGKRRTLVWSRYSSWRKTVLRLLRDLIDIDALNELRRQTPKYFGPGTLAQLSEIISRRTEQPATDLAVTLADRMRSHYGFIRAFHACRTGSTESFRRHGIIPCEPSHLDTIAFELFQNREAIEAAIEDLAENDCASSYRDHNGGKVWFCLEMEELTEFAGHYLLYGSEYLLAIANRIGQSDVLRKRGRATLIECNVPIEDIAEEDVRELAGDMLVKILENFCTRRYRHEVTGFGFSIESRLEPENIVGFHFPTDIPNPHNYGRREN